jgi:hypothetical protein
MSEPTGDPTLSHTLPQDDAARARGAALSAADTARNTPPGPVPGYTVDSLLGAGAFGSVWLATEENTGKRVAIKFYTHRRGLDWSLLSREVEKLASLYTSREIIGLIGVGWNADPPYYVMEYLPNGSLAARLKSVGGRLPPHEAARIATDITRALVHAHRHGILHCDLKPANVLLDEDDRPRLADFGQSRLSHEQDPALGTLFYMAPEQADLDAVPDARWDVYALGALLFEMLAGHPPHKSAEREAAIRSATSLSERLALYRRTIPECPKPTEHRRVRGVDRLLAEIVDRCLDPDPSKRYPDAAGVFEALRRRSQWRSRRPFVLIPALLLLTLIPLAFRAMRNAVRVAETNLAARALESDLVSAKILATALEHSLDARKHQLRRIADMDRVRELVAKSGRTDMTPPELTELAGVLIEARDDVDQELEAQGLVPDDSWFLTDDKGVQRWRDPASDETLNRNFAHRDYFHGRGKDFDPSRLPADVRPIRAAHVSQPYRSTNSDGLKIAISVPVLAPDSGEVVGVLARTLPLGRLLQEYQTLLRSDEVERVIALVDLQTWQLLDHPWMTSANLSRLTTDQIQTELRLEDAQQDQLRRLLDSLRPDGTPDGSERTNEYRDPVGNVAGADEPYRQPWLAAMWPVKGTSWATIVQERRETALGPVRTIWNGLVTYALGGLALCLCVVAALWVIELRSLDTWGRGDGPKS